MPITETTHWDRPGGALLKKILPVWRASVPDEAAVDGFLERQLGEVVTVIEEWIGVDARRSSKAAIPDTRLENALRLAEGDDWEELVVLARSTLPDYWAMDALRSRAADAHSDGATLVIDALVTARARWGGGDMETMRAIKGTPPRRWRPPVYRRSESSRVTVAEQIREVPPEPERPAIDDERALEQETRDILDDAVVDELKLRPHSIDSLADVMNATRSEVAASLTRLLNRGRIWRRADHGKVPVYAHLSVGIGSHRSGRHKVTFPTADEVHGGPIREDAKRIAEAARALGGRPVRALDMLRPDADGRTIARALLDLTAPRRSIADIHRFLRSRNFDGAAGVIWDAPPTASPDYLRMRVWEHILREAPVIRVKGKPGKLRVLPAAIRKDDVPWVAVRRVVDGRISLDRVDIKVMRADSGGPPWIEPVGEGVLEPGDEVHVWVHSSPEALSDLYTTLGDFFDDLKYKPQALADVRTLLFWTGVMLDTPQCNGEAKTTATRAFNQAKLYYDVAREQSETSVWTVGVLRRVAAAALAVTTACGEGCPLPSFDFHDPGWRPVFPEEINTPRLRALYEALGHNPGLARRVEAAAASANKGRVGSAIAQLLANQGEDVERVVQLLKAVDDMRTQPALRAIYQTLGSFQDTRRVQEALEDAPDGWRGNLIKERLVMGSLHDVLAEGRVGNSPRELEDAARRVLAIAKEATDL